MNRLSYDPCAYTQTIAQSVSPLSYMLDPIKYEHCDKCRVELGVVGGTAVSHINGNMVDLENNLMGIDRPGTMCSAFKYQPGTPGQPIQGTCGAPCYKTESYPKVDTSAIHLPSCQFQSFPAIPMPPAAPSYSCQ